MHVMLFTTGYLLHLQYQDLPSEVGFASGSLKTLSQNINQRAAFKNRKLGPSSSSRKFS